MPEHSSTSRVPPMYSPFAQKSFCNDGLRQTHNSLGFFDIPTQKFRFIGQMVQPWVLTDRHTHRQTGPNLLPPLLTREVNFTNVNCDIALATSKGQKERKKNSGKLKTHNQLNVTGFLQAMGIKHQLRSQENYSVFSMLWLEFHFAWYIWDYLAKELILFHFGLLENCAEEQQVKSTWVFYCV